MTHKLKITPEYFIPAAAGNKAFEVRINDRNYQLNDKLILQEWNGTDYTKKEIHCYITYIFLGGKYGLEAGYCVLGTRIINVIIPKKQQWEITK